MTVLKQCGGNKFQKSPLKIYLLIFQKLPTAQYEEEKTKGSFYFKMMGKELFYNSFTDEDVKGFIDDGFLSMQGEFTELLRKGDVLKYQMLFFEKQLQMAV